MTPLQKWTSGAVLITAPLLIAAAVVLLIRIDRWEDQHMRVNQSTFTPAPCRPLPDPDDCVQLGWLDGAWRCIPTEQAG